MMHGVPSIFAETRDYLILYKPAGLHSVPLRQSETENLLAWCASSFPEVLNVHGKNPWEGGILHRLDYETEGLLLCARTQKAYDKLKYQQQTGRFVKEYRAFSEKSPQQPGPGFPPTPSIVLGAISSGFKVFGEGRLVVRPIVDPNVTQYHTEIVTTTNLKDKKLWVLQLNSGFRHQIRCHLAWIGYPIINDIRYGPPKKTNERMALCACEINFLDPTSGKPCRYQIP
ncbi:RNA pseudouridine synthase [Spirochaetia bacterium]|nr:RNA pseudouridine synthase [Spirochaetia bacterium]GHU36481.1 RNA pseudouridine synthase [Spirochaetia bacterium]